MARPLYLMTMVASYLNASRFLFPVPPEGQQYFLRNPERTPRVLMQQLSFYLKHSSKLSYSMVRDSWWCSTAAYTTGTDGHSVTRKIKFHG